MRINIIFNYGRELHLDVEPMATIKDLKRIIDNSLQYALHQKVLVYRGQFLEEDDDTLQYYSIQNDAKIYIKPLSIAEP